MSSQIPVIIRPPIIDRRLDRLQRSLRFYAALDGIAALLLTIILLFALNFAFDRFFEFSWGVRFVLLPVLTAAIIYVLWQRILRRCFTAIRRDQLATALEHYVPQLNEALVTTVELQTADSKRQTAEEFDVELMRHTIDNAAASLRGVNVQRFFRVGRVFSRFMFSLLCTALTACACAYHSETFSLWFSRNILLSEQEYPRWSELLVDGFQDGKVRIGRGDS